MNLIFLQRVCDRINSIQLSKKKNSVQKIELVPNKHDVIESTTVDISVNFQKNKPLLNFDFYV